MSSNLEFKDEDLGLEKIKREANKLKGSYTAVGYFGHGGSPSEDLAARAAVNELGAEIKVTPKMRGFLAASLGLWLKKTTQFITIPARGFMKKTADLYKKRAGDRMEEEYTRILEGRATARQALSRLGEWYVGRIKAVILRGGFVPNSPVTIQAKKSSKPLVDTGQLLNGATHQEVMK